RASVRSADTTSEPPPTAARSAERFRRRQRHEAHWAVHPQHAHGAVASALSGDLLPLGAERQQAGRARAEGRRRCGVDRGVSAWWNPVLATITFVGGAWLGSVFPSRPNAN